MAVRSLKRANNKLRIKDLKLNALLEVTNAINNNSSKEILFQIYEQVLREQLNIGKLALFIHDGDWMYALHYEIDFEQIKNEDTSVLFDIKEITEVNRKESNIYSQFDIVVPVYHKSKPLAFVLIGDLIDEAIMISPIIKHLPFIQTLTNIIAVAIENKNMAKEIIARERMKKELEFASQMQSMLLPSSLPQNNHFEIAAYYQAHQEVGGDYYDFIKINNDEVIFCMADVSGKGISAALLMSNFQANLRVLAKNTKSLTELVLTLNEKVLDSAKGEKFITFFVAKYNLNNKVLRYINAGHNPPVLISDNTVTLLKTGCPGLGMLDFIPSVKEGIMNISSESVICCYTDGVVEIEDNSFLEYGTKRLSEIVFKNYKSPMQKMNSAILDDVIEYKGENDYIDDIAILSCRFV